MKVTTIVGHVGGECKGEFGEQDAWKDRPAKSSEIKDKIKNHIEEIFSFFEKKNDRRRFDEVERGLRPLLFALGRLFLAYFLARREESSEEEVERWVRKGYRRRKPQRKHLNTLLGRVRSGEPTCAAPAAAVSIRSISPWA